MKSLPLIAFITCILCSISNCSFSQAVGIGTSTPDASAQLDVTAANKGVLVPRMNKSTRTGIGTPATGLLVYQSAPDSVGFYYYDGAKWRWLVNSALMDSVNWKTAGNTGLPDTAFLGNRDNVPVNFRVNNQKMGRLDPSRNNYSIGNAAGTDLSAGYVAIGDSAGASSANNTAGVYIGFRSGVKANAPGNIFIGPWSGENNTSGGFNTFIGYTTGQFNTTGSINTFLGTQSGINNTTGADNTYLGGITGSFNKTGNQNTAVGRRALQQDTTGSLNTAVGYQAMFLSQNASENTAVGSHALEHHAINPWNVAVGEYAMAGDTSGVSNTAVGTSALRSEYTGNNNAAFGTNALFAHLRNDANTAIGVGAMEDDTTAIGNSALGYRALHDVTKGAYNTALGYQSLYYADSSNYSVGVGFNAALFNRRNNLVAVGTNAGFYNSYFQSDLSLGVENTYVGYNAAVNANVGSKNTVIGNLAMAGSGFYNGNFPGINQYKRNTVIGDSAAFLTYGNDNTAIGFLSLSKNQNSNQSTAVGSRALTNSSSGYPNVAVGYSSMDSLTGGTGNTAVGSYSLTYAKQAVNNTAIGNAAMYNAGVTSNVVNNVGVGNDALRNIRTYNNTAVGTAALINDTTGMENVAVGIVALHDNLIGAGNTAVGSFAQYSDSSGNFNTSLGYNSMYFNIKGVENTAVGFNSLEYNSDGNFNTALGSYTMRNHKNNGGNVSLGWATMEFDSSGYNNTAIGNHTLWINKKGINNTVVGAFADEYSDSSMYSTAIGYGSLLQGKGDYNTVLGTFAQGDGTNFSSSGNYLISRVTALGGNAGYFNKTNENVFVGYSSGYGGAAGITGAENTGLGSFSLENLLSGRTNTAVGFSVLNNNQSGNNNIGIGTRALLANLTGSNNIAIGDSALYFNNGTFNIGIGKRALYTGGSPTANIAIGDSALFNNIGNGNIAIGARGMYANVTGNNNTVLGNGAELAFGALNNATAIGSKAYAAQTNSIVLGSINGINGAAVQTNVGIGTNTPSMPLTVSNTASNNAGYFISNNNLGAAVTGAAVYAQNTYNSSSDVGAVVGRTVNTTNGYGFGGWFQANYIGVHGEASPGTSSFGSYGVEGIATGVTGNSNYGVNGSANNGNVNIGTGGNAQGNGTINYGLLGNASGATSQNYGLKGTTSSTSANTNYGVRGDATTTGVSASLNYGVYGNASGSNSTNWAGYFNGAVFGTSYTTSDAKLKTGVVPFENALDKIMQLKPVNYFYDVKKYPTMVLPADQQMGFIAQDVEEIFPSLVKKAVQPAEYEKPDPGITKDGKGNPTDNAAPKKIADEVEFKALNYSGLIPVLTKAIQEQQETIGKQQKMIDDLLERVKKLENK